MIVRELLPALLLSLATSACVAPAPRGPDDPHAAIRLAPSRYRLVVEPVLDVRSLPAGEREVAKLTARFNAILEEMIRRVPEQWLWLHNRWRLD